MYIGLDIGTSGAKAVLFSETGEMKKRACREYPIYGEGKRIELCPQEVCEAVFDALAELAAEPCEIRAIGLSSLGEACILLDRNGCVLRNAILPGDERGNEYLPKIQKYREEMIRITGLPLNGTYSLCKLMWIREHEPEIFIQTKRVMLFGDYIAYRLTGEIGISYSLASRTLAFDIEKKKYSSFPERFGISPNLFSTPVTPTTKIGSLCRQAAERTGLQNGISVYAGGHDQPCAAVGAGVLSAGEMADSIGTSECITVVLGAEKLSPEFIEQTNFPCEPFLLNDMFNTMAFTHTAGRLLRWLRDEILPDRRMSFHDLDLQCGKFPSELLVLPHFTGAGTPTMDSRSVGAILGLNLHTRAIDIYQAIMESVSYEMKLNLARLSQNGLKLNRVIAVGGGAESDVWLQLKANIYEMPVYTTVCGEASALGAAIAAACGEGCFDSMEAACRVMVRIKKKYLPNRQFAAEYIRQYERYQRIYPLVKEIYLEQPANKKSSPKMSLTEKSLQAAADETEVQ